MNTKILRPRTIIYLVIFFLVFISISILANFYRAELPLQISGALLQSCIVGLMTFFLLKGQSESKEEREKSIKTFQQKLDVYSSFMKSMWDMVAEEFDDDEIKEKSLKKLRKICFRKLVFYLNEGQIKEITEQIKVIGDGKYNELKDAASKISVILQDNLIEKKDKNNKDSAPDHSLLTKMFDAFVGDYAQKEAEPGTSAQPVIEQEGAETADRAANPITYWHFIAYGAVQFTVFKNGKWILGLNESWGDTWRTNAVKSVKPNDIIFLFRRGGGGYVGVFRASDPSYVYIDKENANEYSQKEKDLYDMGHELAIGSRIACIFVEPIAYNYKGVGCKSVRRRTIEKIHDEEAVKFLLEKFSGKGMDREQLKEMGKLDENTPITINSAYFDEIYKGVKLP
jgi:hypothetical protein